MRYIVCPCCNSDKLVVMGLDDTTKATVYECSVCKCMFDVKIRSLPKTFKSRTEK